MDLDSPLDLVLLGMAGEPVGVDLGMLRDRLAAIRSIASNRRAELIVTGRISAGTLLWLERHVAPRVRGIVEERGLRAASRLAQQDAAAHPVEASGAPLPPEGRPPASLLGAHLEQIGPDGLGPLLATLGDAAVIDTRVLMAHRLGPDEAAWPNPEDRSASDLLLAERVRDPWLRQLTDAARGAPIPVVLGGHSLVGPGLRLLLSGTRGSRPRWT